MLTISLDRLIDLLDKAAEIDMPETAHAEEGAQGRAAGGVEGLEELLADDPAYGNLVEALDQLTPEEANEVLALALLTRNDASLDEWPTMLEQARILPDEATASELLRLLLLTDELELALERLGYIADDEYEQSDEEEEEEGEEDEGEEENEEKEETPQDGKVSEPR
jgi:Protein of unknown function (DUF3775)